MKRSDPIANELIIKSHSIVYHSQRAAFSYDNSARLAANYGTAREHCQTRVSVIVRPAFSHFCLSKWPPTKRSAGLSAFDKDDAFGAPPRSGAAGCSPTFVFAPLAIVRLTDPSITLSALALFNRICFFVKALNCNSIKSLIFISLFSRRT